MEQLTTQENDTPSVRRGTTDAQIAWYTPAKFEVHAVSYRSRVFFWNPFQSDFFVHHMKQTHTRRAKMPAETNTSRMSK